MILRRSQFVHVVRLGDNQALVLHALTQLRLGIDGDVERLIAWFDTPRELPKDLPALASLVPFDRPTLAGCVASLIERGVLTEASPHDEQANMAAELRQTSGRDPGELLERYRRGKREGGEAYWSLAMRRGIENLGAQRHRVDVVLLGDCDLQMEANFLVQEGERRGLDLRVAAAFPDDVRFVSEHPHDIVVIGALRSRGAIAGRGGEDDPSRLTILEGRNLLSQLRARTGKPILLDGLPEPTVQPLGMADGGPDGHRNRFRRANLALADLAESFADVHVIDVAAALGAAGSEALLDDGLTSFTHFGSTGWMLQRPDSERAAVHNLFPDTGPLADRVGGDPYRREIVMARTHVDALVSVLGVDRKKCVVVDLDGVLWPGVLAETGSPFAWTPEVSGPHSFVGLYFGIHEALKALKQRGIVLVAVSKNDEAVVRNLWTYPDHYPRDRLLTPDDFVTWRVNWTDKATNIRSIADEIGFALGSFVFIDDHPHERERVRAALPKVDVWGDDLFALRRQLLTDPRLQVPKLSSEAGDRTTLVKAQLDRARLRAETADEAGFLASLDLQCRVECLPGDAPMARVQELLQRTTQFNTTGRVFSTAELAELITGGTGAVFTLSAKDRFADHGLVGAAVTIGSTIAAFVLSCRVIGLGIEHQLLEAVLTALADRGAIVAPFLETARNGAARHLYRDRGFEQQPDGSWRWPGVPVAKLETVAA